MNSSNSSPSALLRRRVIHYLWREWIRPMALPLLFVAAAKSSLADINIVPTGSMKPTILEGDVVFVNKLAYDLRVPFTTARLARWADPARGDIVVCFAPDDGQRLVKRVIGLPGDTIELRNEILYVNGARQGYAALAPDAPGVRDMAAVEKQQAVFAREQVETGTAAGRVGDAASSPRPSVHRGGDAAAPTNDVRSHAVMALPAVPAPRNYGPVTVPAGHYLMLGDNRDNSKDSRYFGFMPRREIVGEARGVFVSADPARWLRPRFNRFFSKLD